MKNRIDSWIAGLGIVGLVLLIILTIAIMVVNVAFAGYGFYLAFSASTALGIAYLFLSPMAWLTGLLMWGWDYNIAIAIQNATGLPF